MGLPIAKAEPFEIRPLLRASCEGQHLARVLIAYKFLAGWALFCGSSKYDGSLFFLNEVRQSLGSDLVG
jgi:hypothetical protein